MASKSNSTAKYRSCFETLPTNSLLQNIQHGTYVLIQLAYILKYDFASCPLQILKQKAF